MSELLKLLRAAAGEAFVTGNRMLSSRLDDEADRIERAEAKLEDGAVAAE